MRDNKRRVLKTVLIILTVFQLAFIFSQSLFDAPSSTEESSTVLEIVKPIFELFVGKGNVTENLVRKCAPFAEFAVLGALTAALARLYGTRRCLRYVFALLCCLAAAVADESIQLISDGRSAEVRDVLIDLAGAAAGVAVAIVLTAVIKRIKGSIKNEKRNEN